MKLDTAEKIIEAMSLTLEAINESINCFEFDRLNVLARLFGTLFYSYCNFEKMPAEIELLRARAERAREELAAGGLAATSAKEAIMLAAASVKELVKENLNDA